MNTDKLLAALENELAEAGEREAGLKAADQHASALYYEGYGEGVRAAIRAVKRAAREQAF